MASEKLLINLGSVPEALPKVNQVPSDFRRKDKSSINDRIRASVPKAPMMGEGKQYGLQ